MSAITVTIERNRLGAIRGEVKEQFTQLVAATVLNVEAGAKVRTTRVDTGAMKSGWVGRMLGALEGEIGTNIEYAIFHEYGTVHISAMPMLIPAAEAERAAFFSAAEAIIRRLGG